MKDDGVKLEKGQTLDAWLANRSQDEFPNCFGDHERKSYFEKYKDMVYAITPVQRDVEIGAMQASIDKLLESIRKISNVQELKEIVDKNPVVFLNCHGPEHIHKVIQRVSELLYEFKDNHLTGYEGFLLLCAIQLHDVGNFFGREGHEKRISSMIESICKPFIPDFPTRRIIAQIAQSHGGKVGGDKDTISCLRTEEPLNDTTVRTALLAALLRFGDELADDSTRANSQALESGIISDESGIHHCYSESLHTVRIKPNAISNTFQIELAYVIDSNNIKHKFNCLGKKKYRYLIEEIYARTLKMEEERRYCLRFLHPYVYLEGIKICIDIYQDPNKEEYVEDCAEPYTISYTLEESGYPEITDKKTVNVDANIQTGKGLIKTLEERGWKL